MSTLIDMELDEEQVRQCFEEQKRRSVELRVEKLSDRKKRLKSLLNWMNANNSRIKEELHKDFKKPITEIELTEIYPLVSEIKHGISKLNQWSRAKKVDAPLSLIGTTSYVQYEPKGVCLVIAPWNFPFMLAVEPMVSALLAGNTVILKPSEMTPNTARLIEEMVSEVFDKKDVVVFNGGVEVSTLLLSLPFDHIFFTGSPTVGKIVMKAASEHLTSVTLELGGKSPVVIDRDTNVSDAAEKIAWGKYTNTGQTCVAPDYALVHQDIHDSFIAAFKTATEKLFDHQDQGFKQSPDFARIVNDRHFNRQHELIKDAIESGAKLEFGGEVDENEKFVSPTLFSNVSSQSRILKEEIFGPILPLLKYNNISDAIDLINSNEKPLALYYFGKNSRNRKKVLSETSSGTACTNDCVVQFAHANLPFGGVNHSGIGKAHGYHGFLAFSNEKGVLKQRVGLTMPKLIYPPYSGFVKKISTILTKYF